MNPQTPPPSPATGFRNGTRSRLTLSPSIASSAGKRVTDMITASATTTMAATARLEKITKSTRNQPLIASSTVTPAKTTALPDVPLATFRASSLERPPPRSLR